MSNVYHPPSAESASNKAEIVIKITRENIYLIDYFSSPTLQKKHKN
jgi:hypothetical protein